MMAAHKEKYLLFLFIIFSGYSFAQGTDKTEERELYFRINYILKENDTVIAFINEAKGLGIQRGINIKAFQTYYSATNSSQKSHEFLQIGSGRIVKADSFIVCLVKLFKESDTLKIGDLISLNANIPALEYRGIFSDLAFNRLQFLSFKKDTLYPLSAILKYDSKQKEDTMMAGLLNDLHNTYENVKDRTNLPTSLKTTITGGRYAGKTAMEMLHDAARPDLESFLLYVNAFPDKYRGEHFLLSESFAGWVVFGGPYSPLEVKNVMFPIYTDNTLFSKLLPVYKKDILNDSYCKVFATEAQQLCNKGKYNDAAQLIHFTKTLAYSVNDTSGKAIAWLYEAEINQNQDKYELAITQCDSAIKYTVMVNNHEYELASLTKQIYCLYQSKQFAAARNLLTVIEKKLEEYKPSIAASVYNSNWQKRYEYDGSMNYEEGNYGLALNAYNKLIELNKGINSYEALVRNAEVLTFIGRVNNEQGKPSNALDYFTRAALIYRRNFDTLHWALTQNDMAYSYHKLGNYRKSIAYCDSARGKLLQVGNDNGAGYSKSLTGSCYWELGKYDSAVSAHKESIELRKKANNLSGQADSWKQIGKLYLLSGDKNLAFKAYDSSTFYYQQLKDSTGLAEVFNKKGKVYQNDENYKKALEFYEKARGVNPKINVEALFNLGNAWFDIDTVKARHYFAECRQLSDSTKNTDFSFYSTIDLGILAYRSNNKILGDQFYSACLFLSKQLNTTQSAADCIGLKAYSFQTQTKLDSALFYYNQLLPMLDTVNQAGVIWRLNNIADVQISMGNFSAADKTLNTSIQLARNTNNNIGLGKSLEATSFLYALTGEFDKGKKNNDSAIAIFTRSGNILRLANTYLSRGTLLKSMGEYKQSIRSYLLADSLYIDQLDEQAMEYRSAVSCDIGVVYYTQEDYENAIFYHRKAFAQLQQAVVDENYLLYKGNIADDLFYLKKNNEAEALLLDVFPLAKEKKLNRIASGMSLTLGKLYYETRQISKSSEYLNYAIDIARASGEKEKIIEAYTWLGKININNCNADSAENQFRKAISLVNDFKITSGWEPAYQLGLLFYSKNKFDSAIVYFKEAVVLLDKNTENLYGGEAAIQIFNNDPKKSDLYSKITFSYYQLGNINEAWAYANRSNIAGIKELSGSLSVNSGDEKRNAALKKLLSMQQRIKAQENIKEKQAGVAKEETVKKIEILEADYHNFLQDVVVSYPELGSYFLSYNTKGFNKYIGNLPEDVAVLLYLLNNNTLMIFSLTNEKLVVDTMSVDINSKIILFIEAIKNTSKQTGTGPLAVRSEPQDEDRTSTALDFKDISDELYRILINTVADKISDKKKLCIIPSGIFSNMPFQCLGKKSADNSFRFLIEDHSIFYTNDISVFDQADRNKDKKNNLSSFAAFGVPDAGLQYNITEVKSIGKIVGSDSTVYADERATESMAKQSLRQKKIVHFATHGVLNYSSDYSLSYLKLLPDKDSSGGNNGKLTMREIQGLGIRNCDMVILSACQTAVSKELVKGWNLSTANAFLVSNVKTVVASLWKVADEPTGLLMQYFYENLALPQPMEKADALRQAQIRLSQDPRFRHPNYWGAFVLYGDWH